MNTINVRRAIITSLVLSFVFLIITALGTSLDNSYREEFPRPDYQMIHLNTDPQNIYYSIVTDKTKFVIVDGVIHATQIILIAPVIPILYISGVSISTINFSQAIFLITFSPITVFVGWFLIIYILLSIYSYFTKKPSFQKNNKRLIVITILLLAILSFFQYYIDLSIYGNMYSNS